jgi:hypothetical protein
MRSKSNGTTAAQRRWMDLVASRGSVISGSVYVVLHHCAGMTAKHNKVHIGPWWILPLTPEEHDALHKSFDSFVQEVYFWNGETRKEVEKILFMEMVCEIGMGEMPLEVYEAIMGYRR